MAKLFANSGDQYQMRHSAVSDLGLHCLLITLLWVSQLQWVKEKNSLLGSFPLPFKEEKQILSVKSNNPWQ